MLKIINEIEKVTNIKPIPFKTTHIEKSIVYKFWQTETYKYRLELRIIDFSYANVEMIAHQIIDAICDFGDENKIDEISSIILNGGGILNDNDTNTIQKLLYFDIVAEN